MQLKTLLADVETTRVNGSMDREITSIVYDSRRVQPGSLFVALPGLRDDGHQYIDQAIDRGAVAVLSTTDDNRPRVASIVVKDARLSLAEIAAKFHNYPSEELRMCGITGTNGKTTTAFLLKHILESAYSACGLIGTVRYEIGHRVLPAPRTTPEASDLQEILAQMVSTGCRSAVMEVSSHALVQHRVRCTKFDAAIFTNLTQDHLDYHKTMEAYFEAKASLFMGLVEQADKQPLAAINLDDSYGARLIRMLPKDFPVLTYGMSARAQFRASSFRSDFNGSSYQLDADGKSFLVRLPLIGRFNIYNSLAAIAAAHGLGISLRSIVLSLARSPQVPGRLQLVPAKRQFQIFVDYAHTDDALENVLKTLRDLNPARLIVVFGCGGNRDRLKRKLMAQAAEKHADYSIITSDNPRKEDPEEIVRDIQAGYQGKNYEVIIDRKEAIFKAIAMAQARDIIVIAGKGHETYQEFADHTVPFDDAQVAQSALETKRVDF